MTETKILNMYNSSVSLDKIAEDFTITMKDLLNLLEELVEGFTYKGPAAYSQSRIKEILVTYVDGRISTNKIAKEFGHCKKNVSKTIKENNVNLRGRIKLKGYEEEVIEMAKHGADCTEIARKYDVSRRVVMRIVKPYGIKFPKYKPTPQSQESVRKHNFNKKFFKEMDWEGPVYALFFFAADGSFKKAKDNIKLMGIEIGQKSASAPLLLHLSELMGSDGRLHDKSYPYEYTSKKTNKTTKGIRYSKVASFLSIEMAEDVRALLQLPKDSRFHKSADLGRPQNILTNLEQHACRAAFDADGTLNYYPDSSNNKKEKDMYISFYGTKKFLETIQGMVRRHCDVSLRGINPKGSVKEKDDNDPEGISHTSTLYELSWSGREQLLTILDWMYKDATIYLEAKYKKYKSIDRRKRIVDLVNVLNGPSLKAKRLEMGISQSKLAKSISSSSAVISDFERGIRTRMTSTKAKKILDFFNIQVDESFFNY